MNEPKHLNADDLRRWRAALTFKQEPGLYTVTDWYIREFRNPDVILDVLNRLDTAVEALAECCDAIGDLENTISNKMAHETGNEDYFGIRERVESAFNTVKGGAA